MLPEKLYTIGPSDWNRVEKQFAELHAPVYLLVTENKGSLNEARDVYIEAFIYYARSLELHGPTLIDRAQEMVYSFARKLWVKKLEARRADATFIRHRREFLEVDDAFDDIDLIDRRTKLVSEKLAEIGEPCRTLTLEYIGHGAELDDIMRRLGFACRDRAHDNVVAGLRRLITATEKRRLNIDDQALSHLLRHNLHPDDFPLEDLADDEECKIALVLVSRTVAILRGYVQRKQRLARLREISRHKLSDKSRILKDIQRATKSKKKMKPWTSIAAVVLVAAIISALTSFSIVGIPAMHSQSDVPLTDTAEVVSDTLLAPVIPEPVHEPRRFTAFEVGSGYYLTTSTAVRSEADLTLVRGGADDFHAELVAVDTTLGVAVLRDTTAVGSQVPYMPSSKGISIGQSVYSVGFLQDDFRFSHGVISGQNDDLAFSDFDAAPGAPLFNDHGQWVGLVIDGGQGETSNLVVSVKTLLDLLVKISKDADHSSLRLPRRNGLFYDDRPGQIDKIRPRIGQIIVPG